MDSAIQLLNNWGLMFFFPFPFEEFDVHASELLRHDIVTVLPFFVGGGWNSNWRQSFYFPFEDTTAISARPVKPLETLAVSSAKRVPSSSAREKNGVPFFFFPELTQVSLLAGCIRYSKLLNWPCCFSTNWIPSLWPNCRFHFQYLG